MSIRRSKHERKFVQVSNVVAEDQRISWKALGLLTYLLSRPDDWETNTRHLSGLRKDGRDSVQAGLNELEAAGYLVRSKKRNEDGTFSWESVIYEEPHQPEPGFPATVNPQPEPGFPELDNPAIKEDLSQEDIYTPAADKPSSATLVREEYGLPRPLKETAAQKRERERKATLQSEQETRELMDIYKAFLESTGYVGAGEVAWSAVKPHEEALRGLVAAGVTVDEMGVLTATAKKTWKPQYRPTPASILRNLVDLRIACKATARTRVTTQYFDEEAQKSAVLPEVVFDPSDPWGKGK